jgi:pimeloyl-ACP methyl ester carboxylesterase
MMAETNRPVRTWLLLRGLTRERRHWEDFPDVLARHFPHDRISFHDYPGNGARYDEKSPDTIGDMVDDARAAVKTCDGPVYIIGISLGSMVAIDWLTRYPAEVSAAVLISTSLRGLSPFYQRLLPGNYPAIIRSLLYRRDIRRNEQDILNMVSSMAVNDAQRSRNIIDHWVNYAKEYPVSACNTLRQLQAASRYRLDIRQAKPDVPMLVLRGMQDHMVSPECSQRFAEHWQLPVRTHEGAGHDIPLDDPEWVCEQIAAWLEVARL